MPALRRKRQLTRLGRLPNGSISSRTVLSNRTVNSPWMHVHTVEVGATRIMIVSIALHAMCISVGRKAIIKGCVEAKADQDHLGKEEMQGQTRYDSQRYETMAALTPLP